MQISFHNKKQKQKKLRYFENLHIKENEISGQKINSKEGYIKADQLYCFDKRLIKYKIIAHIEPELLEELVQLILFLNNKGLLKSITTNLEKIDI